MMKQLTGDGPISWEMMSIGTGKTIVLLFSAEMLFSVCRYLNWKSLIMIVIIFMKVMNDDSSDNDSCDDDDDVMHWRCYSEFVGTGAEFLF